MENLLEEAREALILLELINLPANQVNQVPNPVSTHPKCHKMLHDGKDYSSLPRKIRLKILCLRGKSTLSHKASDMCHA